ncbi:hypothetical protein [Sphingorhabdus sp. Alg239-R122]|uniref:DUF4139 domain-containing protein n=1 Tax=Sphingorhabdus sp. Alg239-R122 TaxID=2305989 RepID=UPI0013D8F209|nr:hypothetical protein [Sphingorhabdus sp. Alg239-R122]
MAIPALAQGANDAVVTSAGPDAVEVSIYRNPNADPESPLELDYLQGFALVTETREVNLPAGPVTLRFEGVASGILPQSALVRGIGIEEKNRDARLLSQRGLLDAFTGQRVTIRRTNPATGEVTTESGTIRSDPDRVILQTEAGFESLYCTGLDQTLLFPSVPSGLTAKPTLSVVMGNQPGGRMQVTLTYLASNFDWQANYVAELNSAGNRIDLLGWMTMASADDTSFVNASANAIAGTVNRVDDDRNGAGSSPSGRQDISFNCWPYGTTTSGLGRARYGAIPPPPPPPPPASAPIAMRMESAADEFIVVTGTRVAKREELGDLKLYRIPFPVTVAAKSQKQVAFLSKKQVEGEIIYRSTFSDSSDEGDIERLFVIQNEEKSGLGEPLPSGQFTFFQRVLGLRQLVGEASMDDKAVGEEIELMLGGASNVTIDHDYGDKEGKNWDSHVVTVKNANAFPVTFEVRFDPNDEETLKKFKGRTFRKNGRIIWRATVPANGERKLRYRSYDVKED